MTQEHKSQLIEKMATFCRLLQKFPKSATGKINDLEPLADEILNGLLRQKGEIRQGLNEKMLAAGNDVFDEMSREGIDLRERLHECLLDYSNVSAEVWRDLVDSWTMFFSKWNDTKAIVERIVHVVSFREALLIDKDIKVIHDYKHQSLLPLSQNPKAQEDMEKRLTQATQEAMKRLLELKKVPTDLSVEKVSEWIESLHTERQNHFDRLLVKIDNVVKEAVKEVSVESPETIFELKGELAFIEYEIKHIEEQMNSKRANNDALKAQLKDLLEHMNEVFGSRIPAELASSCATMKKRIEVCLAKFEGTN